MSARWFSAESRTMATGFVAMCGSNGPVIAALIGPYIFNWTVSEDVKMQDQMDFELNKLQSLQLLQQYNYALTIIALILMISAILYQPDYPEFPVSPSSLTKRLEIVESLKIMISNKQFMNIMLCTSLIVAINSSLSALFPVMITSKGLTELESGYICCATGIMVVLSSFVFGFINDKLFNHRGMILKINFVTQCIILILYQI